MRSRYTIGASIPVSKRTRVSLLILLATIAVVFLIIWSRSAEPKYQGKRISEWLDDWAANKQTDHGSALRAIGTNALPYVAQKLAQNDSRWNRKFREWHPKLPQALQKFLPAPKPVLSVVNGANAFFYVGSNSIPIAIGFLKHSSPAVREAAAWSLGSLRKQSAAAAQAIPALIDSLRDNARMVRFEALLSLREMGAEASNAVPAITTVLADIRQTNDVYLRAAAAVALGKIGPSAASAIPSLKAALQETNSYLRGQTAVAIWRIASDVETALPILLSELPATNPHSKWDWFIALGEMGPRAKPAAPLLRADLTRIKESWILQYITNALLKIEAEVPSRPLDSPQ